MSSLRGIILFVALSLSCAACTSFSGYPEDPARPDFGTAERGGPNSLEQLRAKYFEQDLTSCYNKGDCSQSLGLTGRQAIRDDIVLGRMHVYDMEFSLFVRELSGGNNTIALGSDLTALALNGFGATTGDASTKAALAAASGGVIAANGAVNKDLFYQKTVPAIVAQMSADRQRAEISIYAGLRQTDASYPLQRAILDLDALNDAASINGAVGNITRQAAAEKAASDASIDAYRSLAMSTSDSSKRIQAWIRADPKNIARLQAWFKLHAEKLAGEIPFEALVDGTKDDLEALRKQAIADPNLGIK